jgi:hypothetical protein
VGRDEFVGRKPAVRQEKDGEQQMVAVRNTVTNTSRVGLNYPQFIA